MKTQIKIIKRGTVRETTPTRQTEKVTASATVRSWITDFRNAKEARQRRDFAAIFGTN